MSYEYVYHGSGNCGARAALREHVKNRTEHAVSSAAKTSVARPGLRPSAVTTAEARATDPPVGAKGSSTLVRAPCE